MTTPRLGGGRFGISLLALLAIASTEAADPQAVVLDSSRRWIDLTHPFNESTIYWPTAGRFQLVVDQYGITDKGYFYSAKRFAAAEHGGTHLDAPIHFSENGESVDQLSLDHFIGPAAVIDVSEAALGDPDYQIGVGDLRAWEQQNQQQLIDVIVLLHTGYGRFWEDRTRYLGTDKTGLEAVPELHFPGLAPEAALWLSEHRSIKAIGIDTASIDYGQSQRFRSHVTLFKHNIPAFENVANLDQLPAQGAAVIALPMKIESGTGAPLRIVASIPQ